MALSVRRDGPSLRWETHECGGAALPALSGHTATLIDERLVVFGGCLADGSLSSAVYSLNMAAEPMEWCVVDVGGEEAEAPPARWRHSASRVGDRGILYFGGFALKRNRFSDLWLLTFQEGGDGTKAAWSKPLNATSQFTSDGNHVSRGGSKGKPASSASKAADSSPAKRAPISKSPGLKRRQSHYRPASPSRRAAAHGTGVAPAPRGGHTATIVGDRGGIYVFGGSGGYGFSAVDFNDIYALSGPGTRDPVTEFAARGLSWEAITPHGLVPAERSDHTAYGVKHRLFVVGGWSFVRRLNDIHVFDTRSVAWSPLAPVGSGAAALSDARWGHCGVGVAAPTSSALFILGGSTSPTGSAAEASPTVRGSAVAAVRGMRGTLSDAIIVLEPHNGSGSGGAQGEGEIVATCPPVLGAAPAPRSLAAVAHDSRHHRLVVVGGWVNRAASDVSTLDVGEVVGPPYAVLSASPTTCPVTGGSTIAIRGVQFIDEDPIVVRFVLTSKETVSIVDVTKSVVFVAEDEITCVTPDVVPHMLGGDVDAEIRVSLGGSAFTTTFAPFTFFPTTDPLRSVAAGPGLTSGIVAGSAAALRVVVSDALGVRRTHGGDVVTFRARLVSAPASEGAEATLVEVMPAFPATDTSDGSYTVSWTPTEGGQYRIDLECSVAGAPATPLAGSPFLVTVVGADDHFGDAAMKNAWASIDCAFVGALRETLRGVTAWVEECRVALSGRDPAVIAAAASSGVSPDEVEAPDIATQLLTTQKAVSQIAARASEFEVALRSAAIRIELVARESAGDFVDPTSLEDVPLAEMLEVEHAAALKAVAELLAEREATRAALAPRVAAVQAQVVAEISGYEERLKKFHGAHRTSELWIVGTEGGPKIDVATVALFPALSDELAKEHAAFDLLVERAKFFECEGSETITWCADVLTSIASDIEAIKASCAVVLTLRALSVDVSAALAAGDDRDIVRLTTRLERAEEAAELADPSRSVRWCKTYLEVGVLASALRESLGKIME